MRVYVYKAVRGRQDILFRPARRRGMPMVLRRGLTPENRKQVVAEVLDDFLTAAVEAVLGGAS